MRRLIVHLTIIILKKKISIFSFMDELYFGRCIPNDRESKFPFTLGGYSVVLFSNSKESKPDFFSFMHNNYLKKI